MRESSRLETDSHGEGARERRGRKRVSERVREGIRVREKGRGESE